MIDGISGQVVYEQELEWAELRQDFDYDLLYYSGRRAIYAVHTTPPEEQTLIDSALSRFLIGPIPGHVDDVMNDFDNNFFALFLTEIDVKSAEAYIKQLTEAGYSQVTTAKEAGIMTWLLTNKDATLSIAYDSNSTGMTVMIKPSH